MTRLPRDLTGEALAQAVASLGYLPTRRTGKAHATHEHGEHHVTVPRHDPLRVGTLAEVSAHFETSRADIIERLFD